MCEPMPNISFKSCTSLSDNAVKVNIVVLQNDPPPLPFDTFRIFVHVEISSMFNPTSNITLYYIYI